jgi:GT2 family glycosyltransferase
MISAVSTESHTSPIAERATAADTIPCTLDIVIVNWNSGSCLRDCLRSIAAARRSVFQLGTVVLVDNGSTDASLEGVEDIALPLRVVRNPNNRGFAAACNQGARLGDADLVLFINPDAQLRPETLDLTVAFMTDPGNGHIGICGGQMWGDNGTPELSCSRFPTLMMFIAKMTGLARVFPRWFPRQRLTHEEVSASGVVDQVIGAYFMVRRWLFEALNGFDVRFFVYLEEVDFAYRAKRLGYSSYYLANVPVYHKGQQSSGQVRGLRLFYLLRSQTKYARKHWGARQAVLLAFLIMTVELPVRAAVAGARGRRDEIKEVGEAARLYAGYVSRRANDHWPRRGRGSDGGCAP